MKIIITFNSIVRFLAPKTFENIMDASRATGLSDRGIRMTYDLKPSIRKRSNGFVYFFKWKSSRICQKERKVFQNP